MSKRLGELVVVAIKARNLNTRENFGKTDPFATFRIGDSSKRTKADKRGGQNPNWDEEVRFQLTDESSNKKMKIQVYNEDKREPILVGEQTIKLEDVLEKGEMDDWIQILYHNKPAGEIYLEMTFYNAAPPALVNQQPHAVMNPNSFQNPPRTQTPPYRPPNSYPPTNNQNIPPVSNNAPASSPASYPSQNAYPPNNLPGQVLSPPPQNSPLPHYATPQSQTTAPYPPVSQSTLPYSSVSQGNSVPGYPPPTNVSSSTSGALSFPVPVPTPNGAPPVGGGGYPPFNGYPPVQGCGGGYYPPSNNNAYPPPNPGFYPLPNNANIYPPNNSIYPPSNNPNAYPPPSNLSIYPPSNNPNTYPPPNDPNIYPPSSNNNVYPPTGGQGYDQSSYGPGHPYPY